MVVVRPDAGVYGRVGAGDLGEREAGVLKGLVHAFELHAVLGIYGLRAKLVVSVVKFVARHRPQDQAQAYMGSCRLDSLLLSPPTG